MPIAHYKRVLLKISGEALMGELSSGISQEGLFQTADKIVALHREGIEVGVVSGGGNIFRGIQQGPQSGVDRTPADQMGMLATLINGVALNDALKKRGAKARLVTALDCPTVAERYYWEQAMCYLADGEIVLFVGGTGHPYFTTDTCAALRAAEIHADILLKATTRVDAIYDRDPRKESGAKRYEEISYDEVLEKGLGILDLTAITLCRQAQIPIRVFNFFESSLLDALTDKPIGTIVR